MRRAAPGPVLGAWAWLLLFAILAGAVLLVWLGPNGARLQQPPGEAVLILPSQNYAFRYPAQWFVYSETQDARFAAYRGTLLASFPVEFQSPGRALAFPPGGAAAIVRFEGPVATGDLLAFAQAVLVSPEYTLTGRTLTLGSHNLVELAGSSGRLLALQENGAVYSFFLPSLNDPSEAGALERMIASFTTLRPEPLPLPTGPAPVAGLVGERIAAAAVQEPGPPPAFRMPWDQSETYPYTGGPHNGVSLLSCAAVPLLGATGLDFGMVYAEVLAAADGTLQAKGYASGGIGYYVILDHGGGWSTRYWHLAEISPMLLSQPNGASIPRGRLVGLSGTAGTGPHLHLELRYNNSSSGITWHGTPLDGYVPRAMQFVSDTNQILNYQGTLTRGSEGTANIPYSPCGNVLVTRWSGASGVVEAGALTPVRSTNVKNYDPCAPGPEEAAFFEHVDYAGACMVLGVGEYRSAFEMGLPNDTLSSVRVGSRARVTLCRDIDFGEPCADLVADAPDMREHPLGNDQVSSVRIRLRDRPNFMPVVGAP